MLNKGGKCLILERFLSDRNKIIKSLLEVFSAISNGIFHLQRLKL